MRKGKIVGEWSITALLTGVILLLTIPLLLGAAYTYPAADDFIIENGSTEWANAMGSVRGHFLAAWNYYMTWEGRYVSNLLLFTILPYTRFGLNGFRIVMVILSAFFEISLFFMVNVIINFSQPAEGIEAGHGRQNRKLFLPIGCFFLANCRSQKRRYYISSVLFGFIAAGTCPQVASFVCGS